MNSGRRTAVVVGLLFIAATVASILGSVVLGSLLDGSNYLVGLANHESQVIFAVLLFLIAATSAVGTALLLFPILRRQREGLAIGYVGLRTFENVLYVVATVALLIMLTVSQSDSVSTASAANVSLLGAALLALHDWSGLVGTLLFAALGSMTLNYVLFQSRLVPRWLSVFGLVAAAFAFLYGLIGMFGLGSGFSSPYMLLAMPLAVQEMAFAAWLIVKGFDQRAIQGHAPELRIGTSVTPRPQPTA
jgi:MFS family permease